MTANAKPYVGGFFRYNYQGSEEFEILFVNSLGYLRKVTGPDSKSTIDNVGWVPFRGEYTNLVELPTREVRYMTIKRTVNERVLRLDEDEHGLAELKLIFLDGKLHDAEVIK